MNAQASNMLGRGGKKQLSWAPSTGASGLYQRAKRQRILSLTRANATGSPGESQHAALQRREALNLGLFTASAAYLRTCLDTGNVAIAADLASLRDAIATRVVGKTTAINHVLTA